MKHKAEIAGAVAGAGAYFAGKGLAKLASGLFRAVVPGIESPEETPWKYRQHPLAYTHEERLEMELQQTIVRQPQQRNQNVVIDMGPVEEYDPNDIRSLVQEQQRIHAQQAAYAKQQEQNHQERIAERKRRDKMAAEGNPHYSDVFKAAIAKAERKEQVRKEKGIIASWFTK